VSACAHWLDGTEEEDEEHGFSYEGLNDCLAVASLEEIPLADLLSLNPSLAKDVRKCQLLPQGASKDTIREYFRDWVHERSVERDGPGACPENEELTRWSPRYKACLYADKEAMDGASIREIGFFAEPYCHVEGTGVVIDGQFGEHDRDVINRAIGGAREEFEPVEGRTGWDVGWMYFRLYLPPALYENLSMSEDEWAGSYFYKRPPGVYIGF